MRLQLGHRHTHDHGDGRMGIPARRYDRMVGLFRRSYRRLAHDAASHIPDGSRVVDVGSGSGQFVAALAQLRPDLAITAIDVDSDMIRVAADKLSRFGDRVNAEVGDVGALPMDDGEVDAITSTLSLHHWPDAEAGGVELRRVLAPDGWLGIYDLGVAPFADLARGLGADPKPDLAKVPLTPLPWPALRRFSL